MRLKRISILLLLLVVGVLALCVRADHFFAVASAGGSPAVDFTNGMVARWTMDTNSFDVPNNKILNWSHGSYITANQLTNYGAIVTTATGYSAGHGAADFPNSGAQALVLAATPISDLNNFTLTVWYNADSGGGGNFGRIYAAGGNTHHWCFANSATATTLRISYNSGSNVKDGAATLAASTWYFAALVVNAGATSMYTNGVLYTSDTIAIDPVSDFVIGQRISDMARAFDGRMQDFRVYNEALTTGRLNQLYTNGPAIGL